jgi:tRNA(Ile2) C34 agmatinyltransferase TiaS
MRYKNEILWKMFMYKRNVNRDGVVTEHEKAILAGIEFNVINKETKAIECTSFLDFDGDKHVVPRDQRDIDVEAELEYIANLGK